MLKTHTSAKNKKVLLEYSYTFQVIGIRDMKLQLSSKKEIIL